MRTRELKRLALLARDGAAAGRERFAAFHRAATPEAVLRIIAQLERQKEKR